jgi:hypothetical protein
MRQVALILSTKRFGFVSELNPVSAHGRNYIVDGLARARAKFAESPLSAATDTRGMYRVFLGGYL